MRIGDGPAYGGIQDIGATQTSGERRHFCGTCFTKTLRHNLEIIDIVVAGSSRPANHCCWPMKILEYMPLRHRSLLLAGKESVTR